MTEQTPEIVTRLWTPTGFREDEWAHAESARVPQRASAEPDHRNETVWLHGISASTGKRDSERGARDAPEPGVGT